MGRVGGWGGGRWGDDVGFLRSFSVGICSSLFVVGVVGGGVMTCR